MPLTPLKVMTFNCRVSTGTPPTWATRSAAVTALLQAESPHMLGVQEAINSQMTDMEGWLGSPYDFVGVGRDGGTSGEYSGIFFDKRRIAMISNDTFWLSATPTVVGSIGWDAAFVRICTWGRFRDLLTGKEFYHYNTHFDNSGQTARLNSAALIHTYIAAGDPTLPVFVTGDFNNPAGVGNAVYDAMINGGVLQDTWYTATSRLSPEYGTFPNYTTPVPGADRIDWILSTPGIVTPTIKINDFDLSGQYPSDHLPVQSTQQFVMGGKQNPPTIKLTRTANQSITNTATPNTGMQAIVWDTENFNTSGQASWWNVSNADRIVMPFTGAYLVTMQTTWAGNSTGYRALYLNKTTTISAANTHVATADDVTGTTEPDRYNNVSQVINCTAGDTYLATVWQNSGGNLNLSGQIGSVPAASITVTYLG